MVKNNGIIEGTYTAALRVDGTLAETKQVTISSGSIKPVTFAVVRDTPKTYEIKIENAVSNLIVKQGSFSTSTATTTSSSASLSATTTSTTPPTNSPAADTWKLTGNMYFFNSQPSVNGGNLFNEISSYGFIGGLGVPGGFQTTMNQNWVQIQQTNTLIFFSPSDPLTILDEWPTQFKEVCPFSSQELKDIKTPFAKLKKRSNGLISAIIMASTDQEMISYLQIMKEKAAPIGVPWTISNQNIDILKQ
jgi:hypothetical protein